MNAGCSYWDSLRCFSQRRSPTTHFWGYAPRGAMTPNSNSAENFVQCKFHHPKFTRSEVIVLTNTQLKNKQTPLKTSNAVRYATTLGKYY